MMMNRTGHVLTLDDIDDIQELDGFARQVTDPASGIDSPLKQHAVFFRGLPVFPLTLAHLTFLDEAPDMLGLTDADRTVCMLWVLTFERIEP
jgi:hypothetical protein